MLLVFICATINVFDIIYEQIKISNYQLYVAADLTSALLNQACLIRFLVSIFDEILGASGWCSCALGKGVCEESAPIS